MSAVPAGAAPRRSVAFIWPEGPGFQSAGQATHQESIRQHLEDLGFDTVVFVPGGKVASPLRRLGARAQVATRNEIRLGRWSVVHPRTALTVFAWGAFRRAPDRVARQIDRVRTSVRSKRGVDFVLGQPLSSTDEEWLAAELAALQPEIVAPFTSFCAPRHESLPPSVKADVLFLSDHEAARHKSLTGAGMRVMPFDYDEATFVKALTPWSAVSAIQWDESAAIRALMPGKKVITTPAGRESNPSPSRRPGEAPIVIFVGSGSSHNVDGLRWFLAWVWPKVRAARPDAQLHVVGSVCSRVELVGEGITGFGEVADLDGAIRAASVAVVPLRAGSGLKLKVVDALCTGSAIVTTPIGAQGFTALEDLPFLVRDGEEAFASGVVELLDDEEQRVALRERAIEVAAMFTPANAFRELDDHLRSCGVSLG